MAVKAGRIVGGFAWVMTGEGLKTALQLVLLFVLARLLTPHDFGVLALLMIPTGFIEIFANMGTRQALIQRPVITSDHLSTSFYLNVASGFLIWGLLVAASGPIAVFFRAPEVEALLPVMGVIFPIKALSLTSQAVLYRNLGFRKLTMIDLLGFTVGNFSVALLMAWLGYGVWALVFALVAQTTISTVAQIAYVRHPLCLRISPAAAKELLSYGGWISVGQIANFLGNKGDNLIVGRYFDAAALGIYTRAFGIAMLPLNLVGSSINTVLFPAMAEAQHDSDQLRQIFSRAIAAVGMVVLPASVVAAVLANELVLVVLGAQWQEVVLPFQILIAITYFRTSYKIDECLSKAVGKVRLNAGQHILYGAMVIVLSFVGKPWGIAGVAGGVVTAILLNFIYRRISSLRLLDLGWRDIAHEYFPAIVLAVPLGVAAGIARHLGVELEWPAWGTLLLAAAVMPPVFGAVFLGMRRLGLADDLIWFYARIRGRMKPRAA